MIKLILLLFLLYSTFETITSQSLAVKRVGMIQQTLTNIDQRIADLEWNCTDYDVKRDIKNLITRIDDLNQDQINLAEATGKPGKLLIVYPDPLDECVSLLKGIAIDTKQSYLTCFLKILWRYQMPESQEEIDNDKSVVSQYNIKRKHENRRRTGNRTSDVNGMSTSSEEIPNRNGRSLLEHSSMSSSQMSSSVFSTSTMSTTTKPLRIRKEYRTLTLTERTRFHNALNVLYENLTIRAFARLHRRANRGAHRGPAFLPWHRAFITNFENALREVDPSVTLPYWDSTLDEHMDNPTDSVMWSEEYLGNGAGQVVTGPFAGWLTEQGCLERAYGVRARLISKQNTQRMMTRCNYSEITVPTGRRRFKLEGFHNGVHVWVGGDMGAVSTAPFDPVFYMHHCFIDYLWEKFRDRQKKICDVDPETDYIDAGGAHNIDSNLSQINEYTVRDGLSNFWTEDIYTYADTPTCENNCGESDVLECDDTQTCLPQSRLPQEAPTTSTWWTSTVGADRKRRQAVDPFIEVKRPENVWHQYEFKKKRDECDKYLDPKCRIQDVVEQTENQEPIPPKKELDIILENVPRKREGQFAVIDDGEISDLVHAEETSQKYWKYRQGLIPGWP